jgi:hypothetical protein
MESMNNGETIEKATTLVNKSFEMGCSGKRICFVSSVALRTASQILLQHARMLRMKTGCRRDWGVEKKKSVRMRGTSIEPRGVRMRMKLSDVRMAAV